MELNKIAVNVFHCHLFQAIKIYL